jgi:hypothetical protein
MFHVSCPPSHPLQAAFFNWDRITPFRTLGGVRIEDNVQVMAGKGAACTNLTPAWLPKKAEDIEAAMCCT